MAKRTDISHLSKIERPAYREGVPMGWKPGDPAGPAITAALAAAYRVTPKGSQTVREVVERFG